MNSYQEEKDYYLNDGGSNSITNSTGVERLTGKDFRFYLIKEAEHCFYRLTEKTLPKAVMVRKLLDIFAESRCKDICPQGYVVFKWFRQRLAENIIIKFGLRKIEEAVGVHRNDAMEHTSIIEAALDLLDKDTYFHELLDYLVKDQTKMSDGEIGKWEAIIKNWTDFLQHRDIAQPTNQEIWQEVEAIRKSL